MPAVIPIILTHGATRIRSDILKGSRVTGTRGYDHGVFHGAVFFQDINYLGHSRFLLTARHVNAGHILALLVDDGIHADGRLSDLAVTNDELPLSTANRGHGIDRL